MFRKRSFYIKKQERSFREVIHFLKELLGNKTKEKSICLHDKSINYLSYTFQDDLENPDCLFINKHQEEYDWIEIMYQNHSLLENWAIQISKELNTQVVVVKSLFAFGWYYFSHYDTGQLTRKLAIQQVGDDPYIKEGWNYETDPIQNAREDVEIGVHENFGDFPKMEYETEKFDYIENFNPYTLLDDYCWHVLKIDSFKPSDNDEEMGLGELLHELDRKEKDKERQHIILYTGRTIERINKKRYEFRSWKEKNKDDGLPF